MYVKIGQTAAGLQGAHSAQIAGTVGEKRLEPILEKWCERQKGPILMGCSLTSDGAGDIDFLIASGKTIVQIDAKNWGSGSWGVAKNGEIRFSKNNAPPKGRSRRGVNAVSQKIRFMEMLKRYELDGFKVERPIVCMTSALKNGCVVHRDENWDKASYTLCSMMDIEEVLDELFTSDKQYAHKDLQRLAENMNKWNLKS